MIAHYWVYFVVFIEKLELVLNLTLSHCLKSTWPKSRVQYVHNIHDLYKKIEHNLTFSMINNYYKIL